MSKINLAFGFIVTSILGILFHFMYDWVDIEALKIIFPYNESIFEHLKLLIFPVLIYMIVDLIISKNKNNIFSSYVSAIIVGIVFLISAYYTYSGIIGKNIDFVNILIYFISLIIIFYYRYKKITLFDNSNSVIVLIILLIIIEMFTFYPLDISLFQA